MGATDEPRIDGVVRSRLGRTLRGKYQLDRVLGVGGMAAVYAATHRNRKRFAIKVLHPELSVHEELRARFLREGYVANSVNHPGAVSVIDDDVAEDGSAFLVMELLEGLPLDQLQKERGGVLPVPWVLALGHQLLGVLIAAHAHGVVHRDLKPANLFLTRDGAIKVLDFGIARLRDATSGKATSTGVAMGTPGFMAPEQIFGKTSELDAQSDVWAVGATLFVLISGQMVHDGETPQQLLVNAATRPARSLSSLGLYVAAGVDELIGRALSLEKPQRWPSAAGMRAALEEVYAQAFGQPVAASSLASLWGDGASSETSLSGSPRSEPSAAAAAAPDATGPAHLPHFSVPAPSPAQRAPSPAQPAPPPAQPAPSSAAAPQSVVPAAAESLPSPAAAPTPAVAPVAVPPPGAAAHVEVNIAAPPVTPSGPHAWVVPALLLVVLAAVATLLVERSGTGSRTALPEAPERQGTSAGATEVGQTSALRGVTTAAPSAPAPRVVLEAVPSASAAAEAVVRPPASAPGSARPLMARPAAARPPEARVTNSPAAAPSSPVCARLLERQSLGERLSASEKKLLLQSCGR